MDYYKLNYSWIKRFPEIRHDEKLWNISLAITAFWNLGFICLYNIAYACSIIKEKKVTPFVVSLFVI